MGKEDHPEGFTGWWIPASVVFLYEDRVISASEMMLLSIINSLAHHEPKVGCYASNDYLAEKVRVKDRTTVSKMIRHLKDLGLLEEVNFDGRKRYLHTQWSREAARVRSASSRGVG